MYCLRQILSSHCWLVASCEDASQRFYLSSAITPLAPTQRLSKMHLTLPFHFFESCKKKELESKYASIHEGYLYRIGTRKPYFLFGHIRVISGLVRGKRRTNRLQLFFSVDFSYYLGSSIVNTLSWTTQTCQAFNHYKMQYMSNLGSRTLFQAYSRC